MRRPSIRRASRPGGAFSRRRPMTSSCKAAEPRDLQSDTKPRERPATPAAFARSQLGDLRHDLGAEQFERAQRLGERHGAEEEIGEQIIDAELGALALDGLPHGLRAAGDDRAVRHAVLESRAARHAEARLRRPHAVLHPQPVEVGEMIFHRGLGEAAGFRVGVGHEDVTLHPDRGAAGEFRLRACGPAAARERLLEGVDVLLGEAGRDRKSTRLNSSHQIISYAVFCLKKKKKYKPPFTISKTKKKKKKI